MSGRRNIYETNSHARIVELMADLGDALHSNPDMLFLGGGNPARIPAFEKIISGCLSDIASHSDALHQLIGIYQSPQGSERLIEELVIYFNGLGWPVSAENICVTNGSQAAFSILLNMFGGLGSDGQVSKIALPLVPEYLGYADQVDASGAFKCFKPKIELVGSNQFRYSIDFDQLKMDAEVSAICLSRPTNPSGNVLAKEQVEQLGVLADKHAIPLIIDCAYGRPFPNIEYAEDSLAWQPNRVFVLSLSKLGLPGVRTGIVLGDADLIRAVSQVNTVRSLASGNLGPALLTELLKQGSLDRICNEVLRPHYAAKRDAILHFIEQRFDGLPYRVHQSDGAFFVWLWFDGLPISSSELYERLKLKGVLIVDGEPFFFGQFKKWNHSRQCIRLSYCADVSTLDRATSIIAEELRTIYRN